MGKDRYSSDHTIEVVGDTNTLTVDGNLSLTGSLNLEELNSTDLVVNAGSIEINSPDVTFSSTPLLQSEQDRYMSYPASAFAFTDTDNVPGQAPYLEDSRRWWIIQDNNVYRFVCPVNNLPSGAKISELRIYYASGDAADDINAGLYGMDLQTRAVTTYFAQSVPTAGTGWTYDDITPSGTEGILDYETKSYYILFSGNCGASNEIWLSGARIKYTTKSVGL